MMKKLLQRRVNCASLQKVKALWTYHNMRVSFYGFVHEGFIYYFFFSGYEDRCQCGHVLDVSAKLLFNRLCVERLRQD